MGQVKITNLDIQQGAQTLVTNVTLTIPRKGIATLCGEEGSGRNELIGAIVGEIKLSNGAISVDDDEVHNLAPHKRKFAWVGSQWGLLPHLSTRANAELGMRFHKGDKKEKKEKLEELLRKTSLAEKQNLPPLALTVLEQWKLCLIRAAAIEPDLLVLEEPFVAFDAHQRRKLIGITQDMLPVLGCSILISTSNALDYMGVSEQLTIMSKGYIEQSGPTQEVYDYPSSTQVAKLTGDINILPGQVVMGGDFYMFSTRIGGLNLKCKDKLRIETEVEILIRPEHSKVVPLGKTADARNVFSAQIKRMEYLGGFQRLELTTEDGTPFISVQNPEYSFKPGDDIDVILTRDDYTIRKR